MTDKPNLTAALAEVQANLPAIVKGETATVPTKNGGQYKYSYADLADVSAVILPLLGKHGLAWITKPTFNDAGKFVLAYKLRHVSGEQETGEYPLTGGTPQEIGSAITYARRYALCAVTGVAPAADDDDGAAATRQAQRADWDAARPARSGPTPAQVQAYDLIRAELDAVTRRVDIGRVGKKATMARDAGDITPEQFHALDVAAGEKITELQQSESAGPVEDRTAEQPDQPAEQQPMDTDWPEPRKPGSGDPA